MPTARFADQGLRQDDFWQRIWVQCPGCGQGALVTITQAGRNNYEAQAVRLACPHCSHLKTLDAAQPKRETVFVTADYTCPQCHTHNRERRKSQQPFVTLTTCCRGCARYSQQWFSAPLDFERTPKDPFFALPLYLVALLPQGILWAWNEAHLAFLKAYIGATLRQRQPHVNRSIASRLPAWALAAKHRTQVLKALNKLATMLPKTT